MKKKYIIGSAASVLVGVGLLTYELGKYQATQTQDSGIAYVESHQEQDKQTSESKTPDQISQEEGISAEQIVVKITDDGYVTSHGDHYHYYNGKVPFDALISEELILKDANYVFKQEDVINEVKDGYIIKVAGKYYVYLKEGGDHKNIRTKEQIAAEREKGSKEASQKQGDSRSFTSHSQKASSLDSKSTSSHRHTKGAYTTDDGYVFSSSDVVDDLGDGFLVPHGNHFHFIPKSDLSAAELTAAQAYWDGKHRKGTNTGHLGMTSESSAASTWKPSLATNPPISTEKKRPLMTGVTLPSFSTNKGGTSGQKNSLVLKEKAENLAVLLDKLYKSPKSERYTEADGLVFDPSQITKRKDKGVVVPHGDHFHFIPYDRMSDLERTLAKQLPIGTKISPKTAENGPKAIFHNYQGRNILAYGKGLDGKAYDTSDGYVFSKTSILSVDDNGVSASHGNHIHYIGFGELEQNELDQVVAWIKENSGKHDAQKQPVDKQPSIVKPAFDYKKVMKKVTQDGQVGYVMVENGKDYFYASQELDLTKISFAEQELMSAAKGQYLYDIVPPKGDELEPKLYVTASELKMHAGNATYDTGDSFVIPHIDHIHIVPYSWLTAKEIASVKYIMQHPKDRPAIWSKGHGTNKEIGTIANVTPKSERAKLKNWQITHSAEEVKQAWNEGRFATADGYIFAAEDVLDPGTFVWKEAFSIPRASGGSLRAISKKELSEQEWAATQELLAKAKADKEKSKSDKTSKSNREVVEKSDSKVTPKSERAKLKNHQIIYSAQEIAEAKKNGRYATSDGYIFDARDIVSDEGDAYVVPHVTHSHWIPKSDLSEEERQAAQAFCQEKGFKAQEEAKSSSQDEEKKSEVPSEQTMPSEKAAEIYDRLTPEKIVPAELMPYNTAYAVAYQNGRIVIPHQDHYHNVSMSWFDDKTIRVPSGYTLEQLLATIKYYVEHPEDRPASDDGWGNDSDHVKGETASESAENPSEIEESKNSNQEKESEATESTEATEEDVEVEDEFDLEMKTRGQLHGLTGEEFSTKLYQIANTYRIAIDGIKDISSGVVSISTSDGKTITYSLVSMAELPH